MFVGMSSSVMKKLHIKGSIFFSLQKVTSLQTCLIKILPLICSFFSTEDDIPTNMSYQDTTLDSSVEKKLQIKGSILIRPVCRDVNCCEEKTTHQG
jgi:uncharacterized membrane protein